MEREGLNLYREARGITSKIRILNGQENFLSDKQDEFDMLDANATETFTLESFKNLILDYREKGKEFIIARVVTPDPDDQTVIYNFCYAASELNRILFRFESDRKLLHRMKVRNPLNNMYILGQVYYYKISPYEVDKAIADYFFLKNHVDDSVMRKAFPQISWCVQEKAAEDDQNHKSKEFLEDIDGKKRDAGMTEKKTLKDVIEHVRKDPVRTPDAPKTEKGITYRAYYFASDDDFLMQPEVREYFRKNTFDVNDDFLFEIDRTQNDFFTLLETASEDENEEILGWKRIITTHVSLLITLLTSCLLLGVSPQIFVIALPAAIALAVSFVCSIFYILFCRRNTFDTLVANSIEEV